MSSANCFYQSWQSRTAGLLEFFMQPQMPLRVRVYACGLSHAAGKKWDEKGGFTGRLAVKAVRVCGKEELVPLRPCDIEQKLNYLDPAGLQPIDRQRVRKVLRELESEGGVRHRGDKKNEVLLYFYANPLCGKQVLENPAEEPEAPTTTTEEAL